MVEDLLFSQISASAWASHKWYSKQAESNVKHLNNHPNIGQYPHTKFTVQELNYIDELSNAFIIIKIIYLKLIIKIF